LFLSRLAVWYPEEILTNEDLGRLVDTTDEWIVEHVGIRERRRSPRDMPVHALGARAAALALEGFDAASVGLVVCGLSISDYQIPATANLIAADVGCGDAPAFDVRAACSSFVFALHTLRGLFATGEHASALLVVPEAYTHATDYSDRATCILWGDAAFACLVTRERPPGPAFAVEDTFVGSRSKDWAAVQIPTGGTFRQEGTVVQAFAIRKMTEVVQRVLARRGLATDDIAYMIGHQANLGILTRVTARLGLAPEKSLTNIERFGNCGAAGAPAVLAQNAARVREGERVVVATVGAGLSWGGVLLKAVKAEGTGP
jgi:3-oxoacyl-[acyl-carrier-protein] synthase-3